MKKIALIGSTGSIGRQVVETVRRNKDKFKIVAIVANSDGAEFRAQQKEFDCRAVLASEDKEGALCIAECAEADTVFNAAGGYVGIAYSERAVKAGKELALANKESLVCAGDLLIPLAKKTGSEIIPVDSEHSAIWQCLNYKTDAKVKRLIITASGGPFAGRAPSTLKSVTPEQALAHPTWKMGKKITIDSATLMNKGYEVIEAHALYGTPYENIETVIHPQSVIHSMVEFVDGAVLAQMSYPTMELPITLALTYPQRISTALNPMDFKKAFSLDFKPINRGDFACLDLAVECGKRGGNLPCVLNAADEAAVHAFLEGLISFDAIYSVVEKTVLKFEREELTDFSQLNDINQRAASVAQQLIKKV